MPCEATLQVCSSLQPCFRGPAGPDTHRVYAIGYHSEAATGRLPPTLPDLEAALSSNEQQMPPSCTRCRHFAHAQSIVAAYSIPPLALVPEPWARASVAASDAEGPIVDQGKPHLPCFDLQLAPGNAEVGNATAESAYFGSFIIPAGAAAVAEPVSGSSSDIEDNPANQGSTFADLTEPESEAGLTICVDWFASPAPQDPAISVSKSLEAPADIVLLESKWISVYLATDTHTPPET